MKYSFSTWLQRIFHSIKSQYSHELLLTNPRLSDLIFLLSCLTLLLGWITLSIASLRWEIEHDTPLLQYAGLLISRFGMIPYRDFFETSMPGSIAFHALAVYCFGTSDIAFIILGHVFLVIILFFSWVVLAEINLTIAAIFIPWFAFAYLSGGPSMLLQRDGLAILPLSASMALIAKGWPRYQIRQIICGILFGCAALIKPHLALGAPVLIIADKLIQRKHDDKSMEILFPLRNYVPTFAGFSLPLVLTALLLAKYDALTPFVEILTQYLPLHIQQTGDHRFVTTEERGLYTIYQGIRFGSYWPLVPVGITTVIVVAINLHKKGDYKKILLVGTLLFMMIIYGFTPMLAGQFWPYHYQPFVFFLIMTLSLLAYPITAPTIFPKSAITACLLLLLISICFFTRNVENLGVFQHNEAKGGRVNRIVRELKETIREGDTIQPLDWTSGAIHAMLRIGVPIATPFFYNYHFYHHVSNNFIQELRRRFINAMERVRPNIVIQTLKVPRPSGIDTTEQFSELDTLLKRDYRITYEEQDFRIYRRKEQ